MGRSRVILKKYRKILVLAIAHIKHASPTFHLSLSQLLGKVTTAAVAAVAARMMDNRSEAVNDAKTTTGALLENALPPVGINAFSMSETSERLNIVHVGNVRKAKNCL